MPEHVNAADAAQSILIVPIPVTRGTLRRNDVQVGALGYKFAL